YARPQKGQKITDSIFGQFLLPADENTAKDIKFCVVSCHDYNRRDDMENGHKIYPSMSKLQPDFYVHTGDIEYMDKPFPYAMTEELMRFKWNRLFALPFQRSFYNNHTSYFMKDDHDVGYDDSYPGKDYGTVTFERGLEIFDEEQFPTYSKRYKTIRWGKDLQIWIVEGRNYRNQNYLEDGPDKTIWGATQKQWFYDTVNASEATFKILITSSPILGPDRKNKNDNLSNSGYSYEQEEILNFIKKQNNLFIVNGDRHWQYVTHIKNTKLWEFGCGAGADVHAGGWKQEDLRPEHQFLRVKGGFLSVSVSSGNLPSIEFTHHDVEGNPVNEVSF
ncbi:MAG: alkaline phosphatase D family protein, partial [Flavobacteriaceae bacterium]